MTSKPSEMTDSDLVYTFEFRCTEYARFNGVDAHALIRDLVDSRTELLSRLTRLRSENEILKLYKDACVEFVRKCENGEARSRRSYEQMKAAMIIEAKSALAPEEKGKEENGR